MKKLLGILVASIFAITFTSCTDMVVTSGTPQVSIVAVVRYGYPTYDIYRYQSMYVSRYPVYCLPPKDYWYRPSWRAPKPPKHEPWPPKYVPNRKPSPGFGNLQRPVMRGPRTFNRDRH